MSIISFVPHGKDWIITMNLEKHLSANLVPPKLYNETTGKLLYAKEANAMGSWFILHEKGWVGAIISTSKLYRQEYGKSFQALYKLLHDVMKSEDPLFLIKNYALTDIEAFILLLFVDNSLFEINWNGQDLLERGLSNQKAYYWESGAASSGEVVALRTAKFLQQVENPAVELPELTLALHKKFSEEKQVQTDDLSGLKPDLTAAVTQVIISENLLRMYYYDYSQSQYFTQSLVRHQDDMWW